MQSTGILRKIDHLGRIVIPREIRRGLEIEKKDWVEIFVEGENIILQKYKGYDVCPITGKVSSQHIKLGDGRIRTISCKSLRRRGKRMVEREIKIVQKESTRDTVPMQERVLQEAMQKKKVISVILVNGFHMKGILEEYDRYAIWIESDHQNQLVYKHAISTIRL